MNFEPVLIGYFPKSILRRQHAPGVEEICNVSNHASAAPAGWVDLWRHNDLAVFNTERLAESVLHDAFEILVEPEPGAKPPWKVTLHQEPFTNGRMMAYKLIPIRFRPDGEEPIPFDSGPVQPLSDQYERLGWDVVQCEGGDHLGFGCSPLFCNGRASDIPVNTHCLLEDGAEAVRHAREFAQSRGTLAEPGPYVAVEVWGRRGGPLEREHCAGSSDGIDPSLIEHALRGALAQRVSLGKAEPRSETPTT